MRRNGSQCPIRSNGSSNVSPSQAFPINTESVPRVIGGGNDDRIVMMIVTLEITVTISVVTATDTVEFPREQSPMPIVLCVSSSIYHYARRNIDIQ